MLSHMVNFGVRQSLQQRPGLARLQRVQEENFRQLQMLVPAETDRCDSYRSEIQGSPVLRMDILERHPYTQFIRLTYAFENNEEQALAPDAHIRLYVDARLAEVTAFDPTQGCRRSAHPWYPRKALWQKTWRQNLVLDKWLGYLLQQGHSVATMQSAKGPIGEEMHRLKSTVSVA